MTDQIGKSLLGKSPLGNTSVYSSIYDSSLLFPIARAESRAQLSLDGVRNFHGKDIWTAYEISWLNPKGKPQVAVGQFEFDCQSSHIIESKSFKLYLNSFNQTQFESYEIVAEILRRDLSLAAGSAVHVDLWSLQELALALDTGCTAILLDDIDLEVSEYHPNENLLKIASSKSVKESFISHLLKTNCPVTGQPDWASVLVEYEGAEIERESLLRYLVSFREHQDFHEHCIERIFSDILKLCRPQFLSVYGRYTRRGGLDINPFRSTDKDAVPRLGRLIRQ